MQQYVDLYKKLNGRGYDSHYAFSLMIQAGEQPLVSFGSTSNKIDSGYNLRYSTQSEIQNLSEALSESMNKVAQRNCKNPRDLVLCEDQEHPHCEQDHTYEFVKDGYKVAFNGLNKFVQYIGLRLNALHTKSILNKDFNETNLYYIGGFRLKFFEKYCPSEHEHKCTMSLEIMPTWYGFYPLWLYYAQEQGIIVVSCDDLKDTGLLQTKFDEFCAGYLMCLQMLALLQKNRIEYDAALDEEALVATSYSNLDEKKHCWFDWSETLKKRTVHPETVIRHSYGDNLCDAILNAALGKTLCDRSEPYRHWCRLDRNHKGECLSCRPSK